MIENNKFKDQIYLIRKINLKIGKCIVPLDYEKTLVKYEPDMIFKY